MAPPSSLRRTQQGSARCSGRGGLPAGPLGLLPVIQPFQEVGAQARACPPGDGVTQHEALREEGVESRISNLIHPIISWIPIFSSPTFPSSPLTYSLGDSALSSGRPVASGQCPGHTGGSCAQQGLVKGATEPSPRLSCDTHLQTVAAVRLPVYDVKDVLVDLLSLCRHREGQRAQG